MKKPITILCAVALALSLAGCGKESSQDVMNHVKMNLDQIQSVDFDLHVVSDVTVKYRDEELSDEIKVPQKTEYVLSVQESDKTAHISGEVLVTGTSSEKYEVESYQTSANEIKMHYYKENETWYREDLETKNVYGLELLKMFYNSGMAPSEEEVMVNDKPCYVFTADVYGDLAKGFSDMLGVKISESPQKDENGNEVDDGSEKVKIPVTLSVYKELNYPAHIKIDMTDAIKNTVKDEALSIAVNEAYVEMTFNSFNETPVEVPEDIKKDSIKKQEGTQGVVQGGESSENAPETTPAPSDDENEPQTEDTNTEQEEPSSEEIPQDTPEPDVITNLSSDWNSFQFEYDGAIYRMPMAYKSFESSGFAMQESDRTKVMEQGQSYTTTLYKGEFAVMAKLENTTTSPKTLYECDLVMIDFDTYSLTADELAKFMFPGSINFAATGEQIKAAWGEPSNIHDGAALKIITYTDGDNFIEIYLDPDTDAIIEFSVTAK